MAINKTDLSFKKLINKEFTHVSRSFFQEVTAATLDVNSTEVYTDIIANTTSSAISSGYARQLTQFVLTADPTYPTYAWYVCSGSGFTPGTTPYDATKVQRNFISDKYGSEYEIKLYDNGGSQIFKTDAINWYFDYKTGILHVADPGAYSTPYKATLIQYLGNNLSSSLAALTSSLSNLSTNRISSGSTSVTTYADNRVVVSGSLIVSGAVSASVFSGSFIGNGTGLTGVTATAIFPIVNVTNIDNTAKFFISQSSGDEYITYGNLLTDLAGTNLSVEGTDSLTLNTTITGITSITSTSFTGSLLGTSSYAATALSASYASTAFNATTASYVLNAVSSSYATTALNATTASYVLNAISASYATSAITASYVLNAISASYATTALNATTASYILNAVSASYASTALSASYASTAFNATTASYASTALSSSYASTARSSSYATTALS